MTTFAIKWNNGQTETGFDTLEAAEASVRSVLSGAEIGHSGDLRDSGERTLFWASAEAAENDDGSRASGSIQARHEESPSVYRLVPAGTRDVYAAGYDGNKFESREEATAAIAGLRACGHEYDHEWDVIEESPGAGR